MRGYKEYFKGKKITIMGLGLLGKGLGDARFLAEYGAQLTITDRKTREQLASSVALLKKYKNIKFVLGKHEFEDFENCDFVLKAQGVPLDSPYIAHARMHHIPIRMDDELFVEFAPNVTIIGVTGTRGKTTTATLVHHILKVAKRRTHLAGNIRGVATLELLKKIKTGDIVVLELSSWQLQGFHDAKISPHIAVFTNFMDDHMNYYPSRKEYFFDKSAIYKYQKKGDITILGEQVAKKVLQRISAQIIPSKNDIPKSWKIPLPGEHNRENVALAVAVARALTIPLPLIKKGVESFKAVEGRLELLRTYKGIKIYNDNNSTTPEATIAALKAFESKVKGQKSNVILIMGGADKGLDMKPLIRMLPKYTKEIILLPGTGSEKLKAKNYNLKPVFAKDLKDAVSKALAVAKKGDIILFSPTFASFGLFVNEYDRNDQFVKIIKGLK